MLSAAAIVLCVVSCGGSDDVHDDDGPGGQAGQGGDDTSQAGSGMSGAGLSGASAAMGGFPGGGAGGDTAAAGAGGFPALGGSGGFAGEPALGICGDGQLEGAETCDDANEAANDGCSALCQVEYLLDQGHIDLFELTYDEATEALALQLKDDTGLYALGKHVRDPAAVVVNVDAELAAVSVPDDLGPDWAFLGMPGETIYLLDQTQQDGLPWPGWSTERLLATLPPTVEVALDTRVVSFMLEVQGPGDVFTFMNDGGGAPINRYVSTNDDEPDIIQATASSHEHTSWVFTEPGDYSFTATPRLITSNAGTLAGPPVTYRIHVGARLAPEQEAPALTIDGGGATQYQVHDTIELSVSQTPPSTLHRYDWYQFVDGYLPLEGEHGTTVSIHAAQAGEALYTAALLGRNGRIAALGVTTVTVNEAD